MGAFKTTCKYCDEEIEMSNDYDEYDEGWHPYEIDSEGERHNCREDEPYETECMYCDELIEISKKSGRWLPYKIDDDGDSTDEVHHCRSERRLDKK